jgi:transcriptional regulator with XRE-family HTH domain
MVRNPKLVPSEVFASRLRAIRKERGLSQDDVARRMTEGGRPLSKVALLRIEKGTRGLSLDEALALARVLDVAPAHLLSPPDGSTVSLTDNVAVDGAGLRNWLLFGEPLLHETPTGRRAHMRMRFAAAVETYAQALVDAKNGGDTAGVENAKRMLASVLRNPDAEENERARKAFWDLVAAQADEQA